MRTTGNKRLIAVLGATEQQGGAGVRARPAGGQGVRTGMQFTITLAVLGALDLLGSALAAESFPIGDVFRPLVADPQESRFFVSVLSLEAAADRFTVASVGLGGSFGMRRWQGEHPGDGWQVGIFGAAFSQFNLDASANDLINTDFRVGVPLSYKHGAFSGRASIWHQSSHLGDEFILNGSAPQRINLSVEVFDLLLAWERGGWRPYVGGYYLIRGDPEGLERPGLHAGLDYAGHEPVLGRGRLVGGLDVKWFDETDWHAGMSAKIGIEFGPRHPERRGLTLLLEAYDGFAPFGQFYRDDITYYGVGLQFAF